MKDNPMLIKFCELPTHIVRMIQWKECLANQTEIVNWCRENINPIEGFPDWQLAGRQGGYCIPDVTGDYDNFVPIYYDSVYILKHEDRVAFTLKFPFKEWI